MAKEPNAVTIYHNPNCSTSKKVLGWLKEKGVAPKVVEYLKTPLDEAGIKSLLKKLKLGPRDILRKKGVALALIDHPWMTPISQLASKLDLVTADFAYVRWLGDRKGIEEKTQHWDRIIVDREDDMRIWIPVIRQLLKRRIQVMGYFNNHYAGFGPGSIELFGKVWESMKES